LATSAAYSAAANEVPLHHAYPYPVSVTVYGTEPARVSSTIAVVSGARLMMLVPLRYLVTQGP